MVQLRRVTRGQGHLETWLAKKRADLADSLIPNAYRSGCLVDIGCGTYPLFLIQTQFSERIGLDKVVSKIEENGPMSEIRLEKHDVGQVSPLPLKDNTADVVTMLAVVEHVERHRISRLLRDIHRVLKPTGMLIVTTPAPWTGRILRIMAKLGLVSAEEINEHKGAYRLSELFALFQEAGFDGIIRGGYFEAYMNCWATAVKGGAK